MWAFFILATVYLEAYAVLLSRNPDWNWFIFGNWAVLGFLQDFIAVMCTLGIVVFWAIRLRNQPEKLGRELPLLRLAPRSGVLHAVHDLQRHLDDVPVPRGGRGARHRHRLRLRQGGVRLLLARQGAARQHRPDRHRPAPAHRRDAGVPGLRAELQAPAHLPRAAQRALRPPADRARRGQAADLRRQADHPRRHRGPRRGRQARRRRGRGLQLEGPAGLRDLHRVRPLPVPVPRVEHREAAVAEADDHGDARPRVREGAVPAGRRGQARRRCSRAATPWPRRSSARWSATPATSGSTCPRTARASSTPTCCGPA